jgi:hypothetical protein
MLKSMGNAENVGQSSTTNTRCDGGEVICQVYSRSISLESRLYDVRGTSKVVKWSYDNVMPQTGPCAEQWSSVAAEKHL